MGDAWASGIGAYEVASRRYHRAPDDRPAESPQREETVKRLRGSVRDRLDHMEPPQGEQLQPGVSVHVRAPPGIEQERRVRGRFEGEAHGPRVPDEELLDDLEHKYWIIAGNPTSLTENVWSVLSLTEGINAGTDTNQRIGNSIIMRRLCVRGLMVKTSAASDQMVVRVIILRDSQTTTGAPSGAVARLSAGAPLVDVATGQVIHAFYNPSTVGVGKRYQILSDRVYNPQCLVSTMRVAWSLCIDLNDEIAVAKGSSNYFMPAYAMLVCCNGANTPQLYWDAQTVFVDP